MTCGLVRLICEEPTVPPPGQDGRPLVLDVRPEDVAAEVARLQDEGWQTISEWPL
ncbi:MAG: hypothetical protein KGO47_08590 [Cyanobacteria bacterium REEB417]|nr:hypothetical protein [Cyanobacteria bacterium REEB417]